MVWNIEFYDFPYIGNVIIPTVTHSMIFQRGRAQPPTWLYYCNVFDLWFKSNTMSELSEYFFVWSTDVSVELPWTVMIDESQRGVREIGILSGDFGSKFRLIPWKDVEVPQYMWDFEGWRLSMDFIRCFGTFSTLSGDLHVRNRCLCS